MKREKRNKKGKLLASFLIVLFSLLLCTCWSSPSSSGAATSSDELDSTIRIASDYLNGRVESGSKVVFLNITSNYPDLSEYILSILSENAVNDGVFSVVDRQQLDAIRAELNFQWSGEVSDPSAQEIGQMLGAQTIVSGTVNKIGPLYRLQIKAIAVQSTAVLGQWSRTIPDGMIIAALTQNTGSGSSGTASTASGTTTSSTTATPTATPTAVATYKPGDTGPAGGLIFYDKGNNSGGWRYLEAAPADFDQLMVAATEEINVANCKGRAVGEGKFNTQGIMAEASKRGGGFGWAAQACDAYELNGYDDWFLPSRDELSQMYGNLHLKGLGNFREAWYWTSTLEEPSWEFHGWGVHFGTGQQRASGVHSQIRVRAARRF